MVQRWDAFVPPEFEHDTSLRAREQEQDRGSKSKTHSARVPLPHSEAAPYSAVAVGQVWLVVLDSMGQVWRWVHRVWGHEATDSELAYAPVSQAHGHHHIGQCFSLLHCSADQF